jgi:hypothetical protein
MKVDRRNRIRPILQERQWKGGCAHDWAANDELRFGGVSFERWPGTKDRSDKAQGHLFFAGNLR